MSRASHPTQGRNRLPPSRKFLGVRRSFLVCAAAGVAVAACGAEAARSSGSRVVDRAVSVRFNRDIRPILASNCFSCHGPDAANRKADLRLDVPGDVLRQRTGHVVVVPGKPSLGTLLQRLDTSRAALRMPPAHSGKTLTSAQIDLIRRWVAQGAHYEDHWAWTAPVRTPPPVVSDAGWNASEIDRFLFNRMNLGGIKPSPQADAVTLLPRLSWDLTGLPPSQDEMKRFLEDPSPTAYEAQVDRLLASPRFGERMATWWFDLVRYADTVGYHGDQDHASAPYRDWVIVAFNANKRFDEFTREQLAGDLLPEPTDQQRIATAYNRLLQTTHEGGAQDKEYRAKYSADRVRNLTAVWLGSTVGCAECHDHKFDPFTQEDFYSLAAFFADVSEMGTYKGADTLPTLRPPEMDLTEPFSHLEATRLTQELQQLNSGRGDRERSRQLESRIRELKARKARVMVTQSVEPRTIRVLHRGNWMDESGKVVTPAIPAFLGRTASRPATGRATRLDLARWLTSPENPLTARVLANRLWTLFFGAGLYRSPNDIGSQGEWPIHPELLDNLSLRLRDGGWNLKSFIRELVTSKAYRQSSALTPELRARDPENRLFARQSRFRLWAEAIRDQALAVSGLLVERQDGRTSRPYQPEGYYEFLNFPKRTYQSDRDDNQYRRAIYMHWQRQYLHPMLQAFDAPTREECTAQRPISNTPLAALNLLNDPSFVEAARVLATRVIRETAPASDDARLRSLARAVLLRELTASEKSRLLQLLQTARRDYSLAPEQANALLAVGLSPVPEGVDRPELAAWTTLGRALLNLSECLTRR